MARLMAVLIAATTASAVPPIEQLRSEEAMFRSVMATAHRFVVRIDTIGGAAANRRGKRPAVEPILSCRSISVMIPRYLRRQVRAN